MDDIQSLPALSGSTAKKSSGGYGAVMLYTCPHSVPYGIAVVVGMLW